MIEQQVQWRRPTSRRGRRAPVPRLLEPFAVPAYRRMAVALVCGAFAYGIWTVALVWEVIAIGGGPAQLSLVSTAGAVGVVIPALLAGVVADRVPQKLVVMSVATLEFACYAAITVLSLTELTQLWHLVVTAFCLGMGLAFYYAAYSAWLPAVVPASTLQAVNGFEGMVRPLVAEAIGPAVAGVVVGVTNPGTATLIAAVVAGIGVCRADRTAAHGGASGPVDAPTSTRCAGPPGHPRGRRLHGAHAVAADTLLFAALMMLVTMGPFEVLIPFVIKDRLGGDATDHALVLGAFGVGGAIGVAGDGVGADAPPLPDLDEPHLGRRLPAARGDGSRHRDLDGRRRGVLPRCAVLGADGDLGDAAPAPGACRPAGSGRLAGLPRLDQPDAGVHGAGRSGVGGDRVSAPRSSCRRHPDRVRRGRRGVGSGCPRTSWPTRSTEAAGFT